MNLKSGTSFLRFASVCEEVGWLLSSALLSFGLRGKRKLFQSSGSVFVFLFA